MRNIKPMIILGAFWTLSCSSNSPVPSTSKNGNNSDTKMGYNKSSTCLQKGYRSLHVALFKEARSQFTKVLTDPKSKAQALTGLAQVAFAETDYHEALDLAKQAISAGAGKRAHLLLGNVLYKLKNYSGAIHSYERVLQHDPDNQEASDNLVATRRRITELQPTRINN